VQGYKIDIPVSIGVAVGPDDGVDAIALWRGAESARAEAKTSGGAVQLPGSQPNCAKPQKNK